MQELRIARSRAGMTLMELEAASGVGASTISKIERGVSRPQANTLHKLADALGVEVAELYSKAPAPPPDPNAKRRREFLEHIKTLDRAALAALSEEIDEEYMHVWPEWERAKESGAPELARLSTELADVGTRGFMARLQMRIVDNPDASFEPVQRQRALVGAA